MPRRRSCAGRTGSLDRTGVDATFYKYKARFDVMNVPDTKKLRAPEDENNRLKRMLAEAMPDNAVLKNLAIIDFPRLT